MSAITIVIRENEVLVAGSVTVKISENGWKHNVTCPGGAPYDGLYGKALAERGTFFRLQWYMKG